jgi:hypothetical protein
MGEERALECLTEMPLEECIALRDGGEVQPFVRGARTARACSARRRSPAR